MEQHGRGKYDLIFFLYFMIYFDLETRQKLIKRLEGSLKPNGYLLVGHSELLSRENTSLTNVHTAIYKKGEG